MAKGKEDWAVILPEASAAQIIARLEAARLALGLSQADFAGRAGLTSQQYTNWKNRGERPSIDHAVALSKAHRLSMDFICKGELAALPNDIHDDIAARLDAGNRRNAPTKRKP
jgi:transcriptional regulator with XRE-family HTH domain